MVDERGTSAQVTASFGIASFPINGDNIEDLIKKADIALYHSKENGRNKVTIYKKTK